MTKTRSIGDIADEILALQVEEKALQQQIDDLEKQGRTLKEELRQLAEKEGLSTGGGTTSKFSIDLETLPQISNIDAFYDFMKQNDYMHLLQRRPAVKACRELWEQGLAIPGIDKFTQYKVTVKGV